MLDLARGCAAHGEALRDRVRGEPRGMLDTREALLLDGGHELAVPQQGGRDVTVIGVDPENDHVDPVIAASTRAARVSLRRSAGIANTIQGWSLGPTGAPRSRSNTT